MLKKFKDLKFFQNQKFKIQDILAYGFYLLIFLLPIQTHLVLRAGEWHGKFGGNWPVDYWRIALYGTDIVLAGLLIVAAIVQRKNKKEKIKNSFWVVWLAVSILDLAMFVSIFFASDKALATYKYITFLLGIGLFWLLSLNFYNKTKVVFAFLLSVVFQGVLAIGQFLYQGSFGSKWLGMAPHSGTDAGASVIEIIGVDGKIERWLRAYGSFDHPNILGGFLALGLIVSFYKLLSHKRVVIKKTDFTFLFYLLSFLSSFAGLLFTFSRSAILAAVVAVMIVLVSVFFGRSKAIVLRSLKIIMLAVIVSLSIFFVYQNVFLTRTSSQTFLEAKSIDERKLYWNDAVSMIKDSKMLPAGIGNFTREMELRAPERFFWQWQPVHNVPMLVLAETSIVGFLSFTGLILWLLWMTVKRKNVFGLSILSAIGIMMILDHYLWSLHSGQMIFWLAIGMVMSNFSNNKENDDQSA